MRRWLAIVAQYGTIDRQTAVDAYHSKYKPSPTFEDQVEYRVDHSIWTYRANFRMVSKHKYDGFDIYNLQTRQYTGRKVPRNY